MKPENKDLRQPKIYGNSSIKHPSKAKLRDSSNWKDIDLAGDSNKNKYLDKSRGSSSELDSFADGYKQPMKINRKT